MRAVKDQVVNLALASEKAFWNGGEALEEYKHERAKLFNLIDTATGEWRAMRSKLQEDFQGAVMDQINEEEREASVDYVPRAAFIDAQHEIHSLKEGCIIGNKSLERARLDTSLLRAQYKDLEKAYEVLTAQRDNQAITIRNFFDTEAEIVKAIRSRKNA